MLGGTSDSVAAGTALSDVEEMAPTVTEAAALVTSTGRKLGIDVVAGEPAPAATPIDIAPSAVTDASTARGTPLQKRCLCRGWAWWGVRCRTV